MKQIEQTGNIKMIFPIVKNLVALFLKEKLLSPEIFILQFYTGLATDQQVLLYFTEAIIGRD